ncbi:MAG: TetR/AcrR family transcriptional regulator [Bacteroidales bacterium]|nr:TetR/AcrR family transcriptional regulator [Bacteroidales bacterium]
METLDIVPTRERILNISIAQFAKYGYNGTSMQQIADMAGIRKSSIYNYFKSKDQILKEIYEIFTEEMTKLIPTKEQVKIDLGKAASIEVYWKNRISGYFENSVTSYAGRLWKVILQEQFRDDRAAVLIISETGRMTDNTSMIFKQMIKKVLIKKCDPDKLAEEFQYTIQAFHQEYLIRHTFDLEPEAGLQKTLEFIDLFLSRIRKKAGPVE